MNEWGDVNGVNGFAVPWWKSLSIACYFLLSSFRFLSAVVLLLVLVVLLVS